MKRFASVLPLLVALVATGAEYRNFTGPQALTFSTNYVAATYGSNVIASTYTYVSGNLYITNGAQAGDAITVNGRTVTAATLVTDPSTQIQAVAATNYPATTTNLYTWLVAYDPSATYSYAGATNIAFVSRGSWTIGTNSEAVLISELTTNSASKDVVIDTTQTDNLTLMGVVQGAGTSSANVIFRFVGSLDKTNWTDSYVFGFAVALANTSANYDATNMTAVGWPYLKCTQVTNSSAVALTNFGLWFGYKY